MQKKLTTSYGGFTLTGWWRTGYKPAPKLHAEGGERVVVSAALQGVLKLVLWRSGPLLGVSFGPIISIPRGTRPCPISFCTKTH